MKVSKVYPDKFFRTTDLEAGTTLTLTIDKVLMAQFPGSSEEKLQLYFKEDSKSLTLNKTNGMRIADALGDETGTWPGSKVELYLERIKYEGQMINSIRVRIPDPSHQASSGASPLTHSKSAAGSTSGRFGDMKDDVPF
jgi:hypothetical protein